MLAGRLAQLFATDGVEGAYYALAMEEIEQRRLRKGLWAQALSQAKMDQTAAQPIYLSLRVQQQMVNMPKLPKLCRDYVRCSLELCEMERTLSEKRNLLKAATDEQATTVRDYNSLVRDIPPEYREALGRRDSQQTLLLAAAFAIIVAFSLWGSQNNTVLARFIALVLVGLSVMGTVRALKNRKHLDRGLGVKGQEIKSLDKSIKALNVRVNTLNYTIAKIDRHTNPPAWLRASTCLCSFFMEGTTGSLHRWKTETSSRVSSRPRKKWNYTSFRGLTTGWKSLLVVTRRGCGSGQGTGRRCSRPSSSGW